MLLKSDPNFKKKSFSVKNQKLKYKINTKRGNFTSKETIAKYIYKIV